MVASNVQLERFRYVERIKTHEKELLQVSSKIVGDLSSDFHGSIGTILYTLLPAGSVTGAPKKKTVEIIRSVESSPRGYFSGVFGYFDGSSLDSAVMIRYIERQEQGLVYRSGGGITVSSRMETEYQEMIDKIYVPATPL
jgi:para-aminobenzoate synthetase component 1